MRKNFSDEFKIKKIIKKKLKTTNYEKKINKIRGKLFRSD